jgi:penicillin-binding protein 2
MSQFDLKDHIRETQLFTNRTIVAVVCICIAILAIIIRMIYLQVVGHDYYTTLSQNNRVGIVPLAPTRGLVFDRNGVILAQNLPAFSLEIVAERVKEKSMDQLIKELAELVEITDRDIDRFKEQLQQQRRFQPATLRFRLSEVEVARLAVNRHRFPGVDVQARLVRYYPQASLAAHAVGYVGRISEKDAEDIDAANYAATTHIGKQGIEKAYEKVLHGAVGYQQVETNAYGRMVRVLDRIEPTPGKSIMLTMDAELQRIAREAMGEEAGAVVAINPKNGEILTLVSTGDFDPNLFINGIDRKSYKELQEGATRPLFNRALQGQYPPGSTFKPFVALAGQELGETNSERTVFCRGWYSLKGSSHRYRDWKKEGHGLTDLKKAVTESCDVYFYDLAQTIGIDRLHDYLIQFGFGQRTGIDISGESPGNLPSTAWKRKTYNQPWYLGETLITGIGQGYTLVTPLQLAVTTATLANRGQYNQPHLLGQIINSETEQQPFAPEHPSTTIEKISQNHWDEVIEGMIAVVHSDRGTARRLAHGQPYQIAGKTGTAQVAGIKQGEKYREEETPKHLRDHALFISFAPANDPTIAVAVIVEHGGHGGSVAAPIAGAVIDRYLHSEKRTQP